MRAVLAVLFLAGLAGCRARVPGFTDDPTRLGRKTLDAASCANFYMNNAQGAIACATSAASGGGCSDECKNWWSQVQAQCGDLIAQYNPDYNQQWFDQLCNGAASPSPSPSPAASPSPSPSPSPSATPSPVLPGTPGIPGVPTVNFTGLASTFECDTAAGFQWITLDASLASATEGTDPASGPAVALDSTCSDLNITGCCTQTPAANFSYVQYGLGSPMIVQGIQLTAPEGECCPEGGDCAFSSSPCSDRLANTVIYVGNSSVTDIQNSEDYKAYIQAIIAAGGNQSDVEAAYLWGQFIANNSAGLCNVVTEYDLYEDGDTSGPVINNGTLSIGCGLGLWGNGTASVDVTGVPGWTGGSLGANAAVKDPEGTVLTLARWELATPLTFCGIEVCAKPAAATA